MAATIAQAPATLLSPPISTAFVPPIRGLYRRFSNSTITSAQGSDCNEFNAFKTCSSNGDYGSCIAEGATSSCNCNYGISYLDCVSDAISASRCWAAVGGDWDSYQRSWFQKSCSKPPQGVMVSITQPSYVDISYTPVVIVTPITPINPGPNRIVPPKYAGTGELLAGPCSSTSYTLIDAGSMVYQAAFVGCVADRPECCPWSVSTTSLAATAGKPGGNRVAGGGGQFPMPADNKLEALTSCPDDYYPVSGQCCPNGYYKFTSRIAYQTPCFSSFPTKMTPPPVTLGMVQNPTDTSRPTSAINNVAWAMSYNLTEPDSLGLSKAATIGIGVGAGVFGLALVALLAFVFVRIRRGKKAALRKQDQHQQQQQQQQEQQQQQHQHGSGNEPHPGTRYSQGYAAVVPQSPSSVMPPPASAGGMGSAVVGQSQMTTMHQGGQQQHHYHHQYQPPSQPQYQQQQQQQYGSAAEKSSSAAWYQGYGDYGLPSPYEQQQGLHQPGSPDQGYFGR